MERRLVWLRNFRRLGALTLSASVLLWPYAARALSVADAQHILTRTGFGASPEEIAEMIPLSREQAVDRLLSSLRRNPSTSPPAFVGQKRPNYWLPGYREHQNLMFRGNEMDQLRVWWVGEMVVTPSPFTEHLALFWHGRFVSRYFPTDITAPFFDQLQLFRQHQGGDYRSLILAVLHDPLMLSFLDNVENSRAHPNENLARELLELFTLGPGNYTEDDVKQLARVLAGHHVQYDNGWTYHVDLASVDPGKKIFLGRTISGDPEQELDEVVDTILAQKAAPRFLARKLYQEFVSIDVDPVEVERLAKGFVSSGYELKTLYRTLLLSDAFWADHNRGGLIKSPIELLVGFVRSFNVEMPDYQDLSDYSTSLGQTLFDAPTVAGWPGGQDWISTSSLSTRHRVLERLWAAVDVAGSEDPDPSQPGLRIRFSSEQRAAPAQLRVTVNDGNHWTVIARHGNSLNAEAASNDPNGLKPAWETFLIPLGSLPPKIEKVDVTLVDPDIDTHAFVDWIDLQGRRFTPLDGHWSQPATRYCGRTAPLGMFYCGATLSVDTSGPGGSPATDLNAPINSQIEYATARVPVPIRHLSRPPLPISADGILARAAMITSPAKGEGEPMHDYLRRLTLDPVFNLE